VATAAAELVNAECCIHRSWRSPSIAIPLEAPGFPAPSLATTVAGRHQLTAGAVSGLLRIRVRLRTWIRIRGPSRDYARQRSRFGVIVRYTLLRFRRQFILVVLPLTAPSASLQLRSGTVYSPDIITSPSLDVFKRQNMKTLISFIPRPLIYGRRM